jgi:hypothetical protein
MLPQLLDQCNEFSVEEESQVAMERLSTTKDTMTADSLLLCGVRTLSSGALRA